MTAPNQITLLRILLIPIFIYFLLANSLPFAGLIAAILFVLIASTDALDGFIARRNNQVTELGKLIDPLADKLLVYGALLALIELHKISSVPVLILAGRDFAVMGLRVWAAKNGTIIAASNLAKWKTAVQMIAIPLLILDWPLRVLMFWISVALSVYSGWEYFKAADLKE